MRENSTHGRDRGKTSETQTNRPSARQAIALERVTKRFGAAPVFLNAEMSFALGRVHCIMGASGSGKTTLLRMLMELETPDEGRIGGMEGLRRAAVFQEDRLCENLSVAANIRMPHPQAKGPAKERLLQRAAALLESMDMHDALHRPVHGLSGGQKRRVAIARAVLAEADVMFFDEPLKGLDEKTERRVMEAIAPLLAQKTVFWVTHHASDLAYFDDPVLTRIEKPC